MPVKIAIRNNQYEPMARLCNKYSITTAALILAAASGYAAQPITEITLPGTRVFPESITSTADGALIIGSIGHRNVMRIAAGKTDAEVWITPGTGGLAQVFGVYADEKAKTLWVCSNNLDNPADKAAVKTFDLGTGAPKDSYTLPGSGAFCNDIAVAGDGTAYVADTGQGRIVLLRPGAKDLEIAAKDPLLAGADGLAFGEKTILYVYSFTTGKLLLVNLGPDGKSKKVTDLKLPRPLDRPDGMRTIGRNRLLMAENSGKMDVITFEGSGMERAILKTIKEGLTAHLA
jgi:sugar lactone lactonase YvrE